MAKAKKILLLDINLARKAKSLDRVLWVDYIKLTPKQKAKLIKESI
jgi:hypothetical protein